MLQESIAPAGPDDRYSGVRALMAKIIIRAIFDWVTYRDSKRLDHRMMAEEARAWLYGHSVLFNGFENLCFLLDVSPERIRRRAAVMTKEHVFKIEHKDRDVGGEPDVHLLSW